MRLTMPAIGLMLTAISTSASADSNARLLTVGGAAIIEATLDLATITAGVETQALSAAEALTDNGVAMGRIFETVEDAGIALADVQTSQLGLTPVWQQPNDGRSGPTDIAGYQASNMITIRVRDIGSLGAVIDQLGVAGANRIYGIGFEVENPRALLDEARTRAVADARGKAELIAKAAGVTLGPIVSIREGSPMGQPGPFRARAESAEAPVAGGSVALTADVEIVYEIN